MNPLKQNLESIPQDNFYYDTAGTEIIVPAASVDKLGVIWNECFQTDEEVRHRRVKMIPGWSESLLRISLHRPARVGMVTYLDPTLTANFPVLSEPLRQEDESASINRSNSLGSMFVYKVSDEGGVLVNLIILSIGPNSYHILDRRIIGDGLDWVVGQKPINYSSRQEEEVGLISRFYNDGSVHHSYNNNAIVSPDTSSRIINLFDLVANHMQERQYRRFGTAVY